MKSRTSCFNMAMLRKNILLYWPIWIIYTIVLMLSFVGVMWGRIQHYVRFNTLDETRFLSIMSESLAPANTILVLVLMSVVTSMALHSYLFSTKSAFMLHAFPITRKQLFCTNLLTGLLFLIVPIVITYMASLFLCLSYGITCVEYLGIWLVIAIEAAIISYSMATFCAMFTGQLFALPIYFVAANIVAPGIIMIFASILNFLGFGLMVDFDLGLLAWLSPIYFIGNKVYVKSTMQSVGYEYICTKLEFFGMKELTIYLLVAAVIFIAAYQLYRTRELEQAGNLLTVAWLRPLFRWGVGICGGFAGALMILQVIEDTIGKVEKGWMLLIALLVGLIAFFVAQMFIEKKFRIFSKRLWKEAICLCGTVAVLSLAFFVTKKELENYIPDIRDVKKATVSLSYACPYEGDEIKQAIAMHKAIVANKEIIEQMDRWNNECGYMHITYELSNGREIKRNYMVPCLDKGKEILDYCLALESDQKHFTDQYLEASNPNLTKLSEGSFDLFDKDYNYVRNVKFTQEQIWQIYDAAMADAKEGNLQKYNLASTWLYSDSEDKAFCTNLVLSDSYLNQQSEEHFTNYGSFWGYSSNYEPIDYDYCNVYINFGADCKNIIKALLDMGAIKSIDELQIYEDEYARESDIASEW